MSLIKTNDSTLDSLQAPAQDAAEWWKGATIYQVYPRSMKDSNGDGVGDLPGITQKLDYIAELGVDAIWISPFFKSPMKDFGYDVSDYREIDPVFGNMDDFDRLISRAHALGLKVIIDQILSHTSDQHAWFLESKSSRTNAKADWYVWADAKDDGSPPNNWLSIFGGCAWQWSSQRRQYYLHNFLSSQPDLNFHNKAVRQQILQELEFWLQKGVDGVRLDAINFCFHDRFLRNNPAKPAEARKARGFSLNNPYAWQYHFYNNTQAENIYFLEELRALLNKYPGTTSLGEVSSEDSLQTMAEYTHGNSRLHMAYSFELLVDDFSSQHIRSVIEKSSQVLNDGRACWAIGNHDVVRVVSRWGANQDPRVFAKLVMAFLVSLPGTICMYQGEELGLTEVALQKDDLQDPYGIAFWPEFKGRDGCRTPMPWTSDALGGFSEARPWLPLPEEHIQYSVATQEKQADSTLNLCKKLLSWRRTSAVLRHGAIQFVDSPEGSLAFTRKLDNEKLLCCFNFSDSPLTLELPRAKRAELIQEIGLSSLEPGSGTAQLEGFSAFFARLSV